VLSNSTIGDVVVLLRLLRGGLSLYSRAFACSVAASIIFLFVTDLKDDEDSAQNDRQRADERHNRIHLAEVYRQQREILLSPATFIPLRTC
jgi:hypothetical protein